MEIWKSVRGFSGFYEISDNGRVKSLFRSVPFRWFRKPYPEKILKQYTDRYGYLVVALQQEGRPKTLKVHRLVADAFLGKSKLSVNHIDLNKKNNFISNLEYLSNLENQRHARANREFNTPKGPNHPCYKITPAIQKEIRSLRGKLSIQEIGSKFGIHPMTCYKVWNKS